MSPFNAKKSVIWKHVGRRFTGFLLRHNEYSKALLFDRVRVFGSVQYVQKECKNSSEGIASNEIKHVTDISLQYVRSSCDKFFRGIAILSCTQVCKTVIFSWKSLVIASKRDLISLPALENRKQVTYCQRITGDTFFQLIMCQLNHFFERFSS